MIHCICPKCDRLYTSQEARWAHSVVRDLDGIAALQIVCTDCGGEGAPLDPPAVALLGKTLARHSPDRQTALLARVLWDCPDDLLTRLALRDRYLERDADQRSELRPLLAYFEALLPTSTPAA